MKKIYLLLFLMFNYLNAVDLDISIEHEVAPIIFISTSPIDKSNLLSIDHTSIIEDGKNTEIPIYIYTNLTSDVNYILNVTLEDGGSLKHDIHNEYKINMIYSLEKDLTSVNFKTDASTETISLDLSSADIEDKNLNIPGAIFTAKVDINRNSSTISGNYELSIPVTLKVK